jgi:hypothetical protein
MKMLIKHGRNTYMIYLKKSFNEKYYTTTLVG